MVSKVLITGGTGFIGSYITKMFAACHPTITVISLSRASVDSQRLQDPYKSKFKNIVFA
jgi:nucleoside-diphosphate-sugar epimerase